MVHSSPLPHVVEVAGLALQHTAPVGVGVEGALIQAAEVEGGGAGALGQQGVRPPAIYPRL